MLRRFPTRLHCFHNKKKVATYLDVKCMQSTQPKGPKSSPNKLVILAAAGITTTSAGIVSYAAWNNENRKLVEDTIPGSSTILEALLGPVTQPFSKDAPPISKADEGLLKKRLEREKAKEKTDNLKETTKKQPEFSSVPPPPQTTKLPDSGNVKKSETKTTTSVRDIQERLENSQKTEARENEKLTKQLEETIVSAQKQVTEALSVAENAAVVIRQHAEKAYTAIDSGQEDEHLFAAAAEVAKIKTDLVKSAEDKLAIAKKKIEDLQEKINVGRDSKYTKENDTLPVAEEALSELKYAISKVNSTVAEALRDSAALNEFKSLVESSRKQFETEVKSLMPEVKLGEKSDKLSIDELNLLLAHAHRKVMALQRTLAKQQTLDKEQYKHSIMRQREQDDEVLDKHLQVELEKQRRELGLEHRHRLSQLREEMELELRNQLKRLTAAHSDHLSDLLTAQESELERKWENKLHDNLQAESKRYNEALSKIQGDLYGLKTAIKTRADTDKTALASHEFWLSCEALRTALRLGKEGASSWEDQLLPLKSRISSIKKAVGEKDTFVDAIIGCISDEAMNRGVYTEEALRERFMKVDRISRRVALIGENGGSLPKYLLSYVQSIFLLNAFDQIPSSELRDEKIDVSQLNTHNILARARYSLSKDDLLQAVKYMNLLRGEPRNVASDWMREAKLTLEAKQAVEALMAHAAATGTRAL